MYPRLLVFLLTMLLSSVASHAQDIITKINGDELRAKVVEVTPAEVRYRLYDAPNGGAIYILLRSEVFMIRYESGVKDVFSTGQPGRPAGVPPRNPVPPGTTVVPGDLASPDNEVHLSGPRLGVTLLTGGVRQKAKDEFNINPFLTQFGWQFETRLFRMPNGVSALLEVVPLVGGLEQGKFVPSVSGLLGIRGPQGFEFGLGPNLTPVSVGIVLAAGTTIRSNSGINFPINVAVVPGNGGARISLLTGFTLRRD